MVLNEVERCAKRQLIERNRERRQIEKLQARLRRQSQPTTGSSVVMVDPFVDSALIKLLAAEYCAQLDVPLALHGDFQFLDMAEQFKLLLMEILRRTYGFASSLQIFKNVSFFITTMKISYQCNQNLNLFIKDLFI